MRKIDTELWSSSEGLPDESRLRYVSDTDMLSRMYSFSTAPSVQI